MQRCTITLYVDQADPCTGDRRAILELGVPSGRLLVGTRIKGSEAFAWRRYRCRKSRMKRIAARMLRTVHAAAKREQGLSRSGAA